MNENTPTALPILSVVVIGLNEEQGLAAALNAVIDNRPAAWQLELFYVDSGSKDRSVEIASNINGVDVLHLTGASPSAAKGRNVGLRAMSGQYVQLIDGDSILQPGWFDRAIAYLDAHNEVSCVYGHCQEVRPDANIYMKVCSFDWLGKPGISRYCGGNAMWRSEPLLAAGLFDESLRFGEEPDLCYRVRQNGGQIFCLDEPMVKHDLGMHTFTEYWKRGENSGKAYFRVARRYWRNSEKLWLYESLRNFAEPAIWLLLIAVGTWMYGYMGGLAWLAAWLTARTLRTALNIRHKTKSGLDALFYALHTQFVRLPVVIGQIKSLFTNR